VLYDLTQGFSVGLWTLTGIAVAMLLGTARLARLGGNLPGIRAASVSGP